ncbi:MAG: DUF4407 domain-containing protein, partial [Pedobacter sp.]|nr:DUF4407 domain-containing protein [Pedobacter sp.]
HHSGKDKDFNIEVIDNVQETRVEAETTKRKEIVKGSAYRDLERYDWDKD